MIFFLIQWCTKLGLKVPAVFTYSSTRMLLAAMTALLVTIFAGPRFIKVLYSLKTGQSIRVEDCPALIELHKKKKSTPSMGGILILFSMLIALVLWMDLKHVFTLILLITTIVLGFVGGVDDYLKVRYKNSKGLRGKKKLLIQMLLAAAIATYLLCPFVTRSLHKGSWFFAPEAKEFVQEKTGEVREQVVTETLSTQDYSSQYYLPFFKDPIFVLKGGGLILGFVLTLIVIVGSSNAVNLTDGLDGLATGCLLMVAMVLAIIAFLSNNVAISRYLHILYIEGSSEIAVYLAALVGACLGFLWYNGYPAQVFMGDTGSLSLGGIIGVCAVLLRREFLLALVGGIFVIEALSVILQVGSYKLRNKKRIFLCAPLHHHFEYKGWPETKVVLRFWIIGLLLAIIGIASLKFQ